MSSTKMLNLSRVVVRSLATTAPRRATAAKGEIEKGYFELKKVQEHFQKDDGKPVFLKGSFTDQVLYRLTVALSLAGIGVQMVPENELGHSPFINNFMF